MTENAEDFFDLKHNGLSFRFRKLSPQQKAMLLIMMKRLARRTKADHEFSATMNIIADVVDLAERRLDTTQHAAFAQALMEDELPWNVLANGLLRDGVFETGLDDDDPPVKAPSQKAVAKRVAKAQAAKKTTRGSR